MNALPARRPEAAAEALATRPKVALVLGAGALKCAAAFGVVKVLQRHGVPIDLVVGCSGGAFCAAWLAAGGVDADDAARRFAHGWAGAFEQVNYRAVLSAVFPRWLRFDRHASIVNDRVINAGVRDFAGTTLIEDLALPLRLVATDFLTGDEMLIASGRLFDAIRATIAMPLILPPWQLNGRSLVDGAVCNPLPVSVAVQEGADIIIAVGFEDALATEFASGMGLVRQLTTLMTNRLYRAQYAFYNLTHHAETLAVIPQFDRRVGLGDVHLVPYLVQRGVEAMEHDMPYLLRLLAAPGRVQRP
jgi:NTE family protein